MTEKKRTASEIRAYCEAASEGPWEPIWIDDFANLDEVVAYAEDMLRQGGPDFYFAMAEAGGKQICPVLTGNGPTSVANLMFACAARVDLPRLLDVGAKAIELLKRCLIATYCGRTPSDDTMTAISELLDETSELKTGEYNTAWLAEEEPDGST